MSECRNVRPLRIKVNKAKKLANQISTGNEIIFATSLNNSSGEKFMTEKSKMEDVSGHSFHNEFKSPEPVCNRNYEASNERQYGCPKEINCRPELAGTPGLSKILGSLLHIRDPEEPLLKQVKGNISSIKPLNHTNFDGVKVELSDTALSSLTIIKPEIDPECEAHSEQKILQPLKYELISKIDDLVSDVHPQSENSVHNSLTSKESLAKPNLEKDFSKNNQSYERLTSQAQENTSLNIPISTCDSICPDTEAEIPISRRTRGRPWKKVVSSDSESVTSSSSSDFANDLDYEPDELQSKVSKRFSFQKGKSTLCHTNLNKEPKLSICTPDHLDVLPKSSVKQKTDQIASLANCERKVPATLATTIPKQFKPLTKEINFSDFFSNFERAHQTESQKLDKNSEISYENNNITMSSISNNGFGMADQPNRGTLSVNQIKAETTTDSTSTPLIKTENDNQIKVEVITYLTSTPFIKTENSNSFRARSDQGVVHPFSGDLLINTEENTNLQNVSLRSTDFGQNESTVPISSGSTFQQQRGSKLNGQIFNKLYCPTCPNHKGIWNLTSYKRHLLKHSEEKSFACTDCDQKFETAGAMCAHKLSHPNPNAGVLNSKNGSDIVNNKPTLYKCTACKLTSKSISELKTHICFREFKCLHCHQAFFYKHELEKHSREHAGNNLNSKNNSTNSHQKMKPSTDSKLLLPSYSQVVSANQSPSNQTGKPNFECPQCFMHFKHYNDFRTHFWEHTKPKNFSCEMCKQKFESEKDLSEHRDVCTFACKICNKIFESFKALSDHYLIHNSTNADDKSNKSTMSERTNLSFQNRIGSTIIGRKRKCPACPRTVSASGYKRHLWMHGREKSFGCNSCDKKFESAGAMCAHKLSHDMNIESKNNKKPNKTAEQETLFRCTVCNITTFTVNELKSHTCYNIGTKFKCFYCSKVFFHAYELESHVLIHLSETNKKPANSIVQLSNSVVELSKVSIDNVASSPDASKTTISLDENSSSNSTHTSNLKTGTADSSRRRFYCPVCPREFPKVYPFKIHIWRHGKAKEFSCKICGQKFGSAGAMCAHEITHIINNPEFQQNVAKTNDKSAEIEIQASENNNQSVNKDVFTETNDSSTDSTDNNISAGSSNQITEINDNSLKFKHRSVETQIRLPEINEQDSKLVGYTEKTKNKSVNIGSNKSLEIGDHSAETNDEPIGYQWEQQIKWFRSTTYSEPSKVELILCKCRACDDTFDSSNKLESHACFDMTADFECPCCFKIYPFQRLLDEHAKCHLPDKDKRIFQCTTCDKLFSKKATLKKHENIVHNGVESFRCKQCNCRWMNKEKFQNHLCRKRVRYPLKKAECPVCHRVLVSAQALKGHLQTHTGEKKFLCDTCGRKFASKLILNNHVSSHSEERPHLCDFCARSFKTDGALKRHIDSVHKKSETSFHCTICDKSFTPRDNYVRHLRIHTGEKPYQCKLCGHRTTQSSTLKSHIKACHKGAVVADAIISDFTSNTSV